MLMSKSCAILPWTCLLVLKKNSCDFSLFITCPEADVYSSSVFPMPEASRMEASPNMMVSSANWECVIASNCSWTLIPFQMPSWCLFFITLPSNSTMKTNNEGDKGSPCHRPFMAPKNPLKLPLISIENLIVLMHNFMHLIQFPGKPNLTSTWQRKLQITLS